MKVREVMATELITVDKDRSLKDVLRIMEQHNVTKLPVVDHDGRLLGIVTDGRIADKLGRAHNRSIKTATLRASGVMEKDFLRAHPDEAIETLLADVGKPGLTMVPVVKGDMLVGVVTKSDLLKLVQSKRKVRDVMKKQLLAVGPDERLVHARRLLLDNDIARLPVLHDGHLQGIIAEHEIANAFAGFKDADSHVQKAMIRELHVVDYMRRDVVTGQGDMSLAEAASRMREFHVGALPIVNGAGTIEGIVTRTDLIKHYAS